MKLCDNCLEGLAPTDRPVPVGPEKGTQRDPYHSTLDLCTDCSNALVEGDLHTFHGRYNKNLHIDRGN